MKPVLIQHKLVVKKSAIHGYGVFATEDIPAGAIIEECPVVKAESRYIEFNNFYFHDFLIPWGYGALYNHADKPNADFKYDQLNSLMIFTALRLIKKDEEIYIRYGATWFSSRDLKVKKLSFWQRVRRRNHWLRPYIRTLWRAVVIVALFFIFVNVMKRI